MAALWALLLGAVAALVVQSLANAWLLTQRSAIEARLSEAMDAPVRVGAARIVWRDFRPLLALRDLHLIAGDAGPPMLRIASLRVGVAPEALLAGRLQPNRLQLQGSEIRLEEEPEGWRIARGGGEGLDAEALQRLLAGFAEITVRDVGLSAQPLRPGVPIEAQLDRLRLLPERGGWRVRALIYDGAKSGRLELNGMLMGDAAEPSGWRHSWQLAFDGSHDLATSLGRLDARLPAPRLDGIRLRASLRSQGQGIAEGWMASIDLRSARLALPEAGHLVDLRLMANARLDDGRLTAQLQQLRLQGAEQSDGLRVTHDLRSGQGRLQAERLGLAVLSPLLAADERLPSLEGALGELSVRWRDGEGAERLAALQGRLENVALSGAAYRVEGLSGRISGDGRSGELRLPEQALSVALPEHLFAPLHMQRAAGVLSWEALEAGGYALRLSEMALALDSVRADGEAALSLPADAPPQLRLDLALSAELVDHAKPFMPRVWPAGLRDYLARSIEQARVPEGRLRFEAALEAGLMRKPETLFNIDLAVRDARMRFHPDWPAARDIQGSVAIDAQGIAIAAERAELAGLGVSDVRVAIPDFSEAVLSAQAQHRAALPDWYAFLADSPLAEPLHALIEDTHGAGEADLDFELTVPLKKTEETTAEGVVRVADVSLTVDAIDATFHDLRGRLHFVNTAIAADPLDASLHGQPVRARLDTREGVPYLSAQSRVDLADPQGLVGVLPAWLRPRLQGIVPVSVELALARVGDAIPLSLAIGSRLLHVDLPRPLALRPDAVRDDIAVELRLREEGIDDMHLRLPGRLALRVDGARTQLHLGPGRMPQEQAPGLHVSGHADALPLGPWLRVARVIGEAEDGARAPLTGSLQAGGLRGLDLTTDALLLGGFAVPDVALHMDSDADGHYLQLDGATRGVLDIRTAQARPHIEGRFERLRLQRADDMAGTEDDAPASGQERLDPRELPSADVLVGDLLLDELRLGQLDLRLDAEAAGLRLSRLNLSDGALDLQASGTWHGGESAGMWLEADLDSADIDGLLSALGYARTLSAARFEASAALQWDELARTAQLANAEGRLTVTASDGNLAAVEPGAGRMLGLFNFFALPRRLGLDFRDVTEGGLAFDRLSGSFQLGGGDARTDDLRLEGPSLRVEVAGRVGLAARDYDQRIRIYPDLSGGMTIGGAVLGGPIGVGIALLARELFEVPIEAATRIEYRLVGSWADPRIIPEDVDTIEEEVPR